VFLLPLLSLAVIFFLGLVVGSFLNVLVTRTERDEAPTGRSHCDTCSKTLSWRELIPIVSFVYQKGRCLHCGIVLSVQYPLMELGTGVIFSLVGGSQLYDFVLRGDAVSLLSMCFFLIAASAMIVIVVADMRYQIIPNGAVLTLLVQGMIAGVLRNGLTCISVAFPCASFSFSGIEWDVIIALVLMFFLFALWYLSKGSAMGFGDVKLIAAIALLVGFPLSLIGFVFAFWLGGIWGVLLLITKTKGPKSQIAFGPFIIAGYVMAFFFGNAFLAASGFRYLLL
jgi:prepilin signal peptidase PulO-like enzyme (type II secretory pathway)